MKYSKSDSDKAFDFQRKELANYVDCSYQQVAELKAKGRMVIKSPPGLKHFNFALEVRDGDDGGLELCVFHHDLPPYDEVPQWIKDACGIDDITLGEGRYNVWFEIYKDNRIEWPDTEHRDGDD